MLIGLRVSGLAAALTALMVGLSSQAFASEPPRVLSWDDLMPEGESEVLMQLYENFYREMESRLASSAMTLSQAAGVAGIAEGSPLDFMPQIGTFNVVDELNGEQVRIPGYVVPLNFNAANEYAEFLLVPYFGACLHAPPPPPNQIVYVTADPVATVGEIWEPVWVEGVMKTEKNENDTGDAAYTIELSKLELYEF